MKKTKISLLLLIIYLTTINLALAENRYVSTQGTDPPAPAAGCCADPENPCRTIALAFTYSGSAGNNILVAKGTYTDEYIHIANVTASGKVIQGGWNEDFTEKTFDPSLTVIQGKSTKDYVFDIGGLNINGLVVDNFTITNPTVSGSGTYGVNFKSNQAYTVTATLKNLIIQEAGSQGLHIWTTNNGVVNATVENSIISNNGRNGISCSASGYSPDYFQSTIALNITNCTIADNDTAGGSIYGVSLFSIFNGQITTSTRNSILWGHENGDIVIAVDDAIGYSPEVTATISYSDIENVTNVGGTYSTGNGMISQNPVFVSPLKKNYHINDNSPCRGTGIYQKKVFVGGTWIFTDYNIPDNDFEGDPRNSEWIEDPTNTFHKYCDMGADEFTLSGGLPGILLLLLLND